MSKLMVELRFRNEKNRLRSVTLYFKDEQHLEDWIALKEHYGCSSFVKRVIPEQFHKVLSPNVKQAKSIKYNLDGKISEMFEKRQDYRRNDYSVQHHRDNVQLNDRGELYMRNKSDAMQGIILNLIKGDYNMRESEAKFVKSISGMSMLSHRQKNWLKQISDKYIKST